MRAGQNTTRARKLRRDATLPERKAWRALRRFRAIGYPVRRQHPVAGLTVDFAVTAQRLAIEVDGPMHQRSAVATLDAARDARLAAAGWTVLRLPWELADDPDALFARVAEVLGVE